MTIINLHSKDATINKIGAGVYQFSFNLNGIIFDRFDSKTRLYIQDFNLCELYDNTSDHYINGSFQLRCNFINGKEIIDSNRESISNNIIFAGNLTSYKNFINTNPMFMYNYKINESTFNAGFLTFTLHLFDELGSNFTTWQTTEYTLDEATTAFSTYNTKLKTLNETKQLLSDTKDLIQDSSEKRTFALGAFSTVEKEFINAKQDLMVSLTSRIGDTTLIGFALADSKTMEQVRTQHQAYIQIISDADNLDILIDLLNQTNFTIGFPYYTGNNSGIRKKYSYLKNNALPNYITTLLDAQQLFFDGNHLSDGTDLFIRHVKIFDVVRTNEEKLPLTNVFFKSTSVFKNYSYSISYDTNTKEATGTISLKIKSYYDNVLNITVDKILPNSADDDNIENIPDPVLNFFVSGLDDSGISTTTTDLLSFKVRKEDLNNNSLLRINGSIITQTSLVANAKASVPLISNIRTISIDDNIASKLPNINLSMVLYNEEIELQSIKGSESQNTISKSYLPQYKRI